MPLYFQYLIRRARRVAVPAALVFSLPLAVLFIVTFVFGVSRTTLLGFVPAPVKAAGRGAIAQLSEWSVRFRDLPYAVYRFRQSHLPVYDLVIGEQQLDELDAYYAAHAADYERAKDYKNAKFFAEGEEYNVRVSYRGEGDIHFAYDKKSWRIRFPQDHYFHGMKSINLIIPEDRLFIGEYFNNYRAPKLGVPVPASDFAVLRVNGKSSGVYFVIEQPSAAFLERAKLNPDANFYGEDTASGLIWSDVSLWQKFSENPQSPPDDFSDLAELLKLLAHPSDAYFWQRIPTLVDLDEFFRWQAHSALSGSPHQDAFHNARLYFDPTIGRFKFIPWDVYIRPLDYIGTPEQGMDFIDYNPLVQRILKNPEYLEERNRILWEYVKDESNLKDDLAWYDREYNRVRIAFYQDTIKRYPNSVFRRVVRETRQTIGANFHGLREMLQRSEMRVGSRLNLPASLNTRTFTTIQAAIDIELKALAPQRISRLEIRDLPTTAPTVAIYHDRNQNGLLDAGDALAWQGPRTGNAVFVAEGLTSVLRSELITKPEPTELGLGRTHVVPTTHRLFVLAGYEPMRPPAKQGAAAPFVTVSVRNDITGTETAAAGESFVDDARFARRDAIAASAVQFAAAHPAFFKTAMDAVALPAGYHAFQETVVVPSGVRLTIAPGATLAFARDVSLIVYGPVTAEGTAGEPIFFVRLNPGEAWGSFAVIRAEGKSVFRFTRFDGGSSVYENGVFARAMLALFESPTEITDTLMSNAAADDALNVKNTEADIRRNRFERNSADAIDLDFVNGEVAGNMFISNGNDSVDVSGSRLIVRDNRMIGSGDKGISIGEDSKVDAINNIITRGSIGIAVKDSSRALILENTIVGNKSGLELYQKKEIFGGAAATRVVNSVIWANGRNIYHDDVSQPPAVRSGTIEGGYGGEGVLTILPRFTNPEGMDYSLAEGLPENEIFRAGGFKGALEGEYGTTYEVSGRIGAVPPGR